MAIYGIGTDIVSISRIKNIVSLYQNNRFAKRILRPTELQKYLTCKYPVHFLAKRFVAKEAACKALGTGIRHGLTFSQFEVFNDELGKPILRLFSQAATLANQLSICRMHITLADEYHYACATVILES